MNSRSTTLALALGSLAQATLAQSITGHSVSRQTSDSASSGIPVSMPIEGVQLDTTTPPPTPPPPPHGMSRVPAANLGTGPRTWPRDTSKSPGHWRLGLHASAHDIGLLLGASASARSIALGLDGWIRPGAFTKEVRITPTRRAQYKEVLWGIDPWIQAQVGSDLRVAVVAALDLVSAHWYGTENSPQTDVQPALGLKLLFPEIFQIGVRRTWEEGLAGRWRGEVVCEF